MIMSLPSSCLSSSSVFEYGNYKTVVLFRGSQDDDDSSSSPPPKPLLIGTPSEGGDFPVLLLLHGFMMKHTFYSQLIQHIASHGFIVVAPQLYTLACADATRDIKAAADITDWLAKGSLEDLLPSNVHPMLEKVALSGHSRGGKAAFALALSKVASSALKLSALIGIDPVDGSTRGQSTPPAVLTGAPDSLNLDGMPVMVIGSGLGATKKNFLVPPCAPEGVNHDNFYKECQAPAWYFLVKDYGHMDMLDDETKGITGMMTSMISMNGKSREPMRKFVGGVLVAFLRAYLMGDDSDLIAIRDGEQVEIPVEFHAVDFRP
ncbi:hypothetical protein Dimus_010123 [Dionaea muscipula]